MCTTFAVSGLNLQSFNGVLSSSNLPKKINLILLGLLGCASHSSLHSLNINSFNVYTLILNGSFLPASVIPGTLTFRFARYFSSILYGCRAPDVNNNVITRTGPASLPDTGAGGLSVDGPIAIESRREIAGCAGVVMVSLFDTDKGLVDFSVWRAAGVEPSIGTVFPGLVFSPEVPAAVFVVVDVGKVESMVEDAGFKTSLRKPPCEPSPSAEPAPAVLLDTSRSLISTALLDDVDGRSNPFVDDTSLVCVAVPCPPAPVDSVADLPVSAIGWILSGGTQVYWEWVLERHQRGFNISVKVMLQHSRLRTVN